MQRKFYRQTSGNYKLDQKYQNMSIANTLSAAASVFLLDPFLLIQQRLRKKTQLITYMQDDPLRRRIRFERLRISRAGRGHPPYHRQNFNLHDHTDHWYLEYLRFTKFQIMEMVEGFNLNGLELRKRCVAKPETCLAVVLYRLSFPNRLKNCCDVCLLSYNFTLRLFFIFYFFYSVIYIIIICFCLYINFLLIHVY